MYDRCRYVPIYNRTAISVVFLSLAVGRVAVGEPYECLIEPSKVIEIASPSVGVLAEVLVERGDHVDRDQLVARLQNDVERATVVLAERRAGFEAGIEAAKTRIVFQQRELERRRELHKQDHVAERDLEEAETDARLAELRLEELIEGRELAVLELTRTRVILKMRGVYSTEDALVVERYKNPGEYVEEEPILRLAVVQPLFVETVLPVQMLGQIKEGTSATIRPEEPFGGEFVATVTVVDEVIDAATSTFRVRLELLNDNKAIPAGLRCQIDFDHVGVGLTNGSRSGVTPSDDAALKDANGSDQTKQGG